MKTRFSPSPSGLLHVGNIRTAIFNYFASKSVRGTFLLRIEDTDRKTISSKNIDNIIMDLKSIGINWDEGIEKENSIQYLQSNRNKIYDEYIDKLVKKNKAYYCFCSEERLSKLKHQQSLNGRPPRYDGTCANLSREDIKKKLTISSPVVRLRVNHHNIIFNDIVRGVQSFKSENFDDFIIRRSNGSSSFIFTNVLDDCLMKITLSIRGEDHLANTPKQLLIAKALELTPPDYGHISLIVDENRKKISKRDGGLSLKKLLDLGYHPLAIINYLSRLGHSYSNNNLMTKEQLINEFSLDKLIKSSAIFSIEQLNSWQKLCFSTLLNTEIIERIPDDLFVEQSMDYKNEVISILKSFLYNIAEVKFWLSIIKNKDIDWSDDNSNILKSVKSSYYELIIEGLENNIELKEILNNIKNKLKIKGKVLFLPFRIAMTGMNSGPELQQLIKIIPKNIMLYRLNKIKIYICNHENI